MNTNKEISKEIISSTIWIAIGLLALIVGHILNYQKQIMNGIAIGTTPFGIIQLLFLNYIKNNKGSRMRRNFELEKDERNVYINTKAGHTAFWVSYCYIVVVTIFSNALNLTLLQFLILTMIFMSIIYFALLFLYHKKY